MGVQQEDKKVPRTFKESLEPVKKYPHWIKILIVVFLLSTTVLVSYTLYVNQQMKSLVSARSTELDIYENTKQWVLEDLRHYLTISSLDEYNNVKGSVHFTKEYQQMLFGSSYNSLKYLSADSVSFVDAQYTVDSKSNIMYFVVANVTKQGKTAEMNFLISVENNKIYDIESF